MKRLVVFLLLLFPSIVLAGSTVYTPGSGGGSGTGVTDALFDTCIEGEVVKIVSGAKACATDSTGGTPSFDAVTPGTNTKGEMVVGTGSSLVVSGSGTIASTTAAALAANGANCAAPTEFAVGVSAGGIAECEAITDDDVPDDITIDVSGDVVVTSGVATIQDNSVDGSDLILSGELAGSLMYFFGTSNSWVPLNLGSSGQVLGVGSSVPAWVTPVTLIASGSVAIDPASIASEQCNTSNTTDTATGVTTTDVITWTPNASMHGVNGYAPVTTGGVIIYVFPTTDTVNFRVCNPTENPIDPDSITVNWSVIR